MLLKVHGETEEMEIISTKIARKEKALTVSSTYNIKKTCISKVNERIKRNLHANILI